MIPFVPPTPEEIESIRSALPRRTPTMKGRWESMETAPRDGRPVWVNTFTTINYCETCVAAWASYKGAGWVLAGTRTATSPHEWFNPEADA